MNTKQILSKISKKLEEYRCLHGPSPLQHLNAYQVCHHESNHNYSRWVSSEWGGLYNPLLRARQKKCCRRRPTTQHTPAEHKISINEQLAYKNKAFIIVLQEPHCTTADKLVIPNFSLAGPILSRKHGLATFVSEQLEWSLVDQSPEHSETEWLCVDIAGHKIISVCKPPRSRLTPKAIASSPHPILYVGDFNFQHDNWGNNKTSPDGESLDT